MFSRDKDSATGTGIPDSYGFIPAHRGDAFAIGRPREGSDTIRMLIIGENTSAHGQVPHLYRLIITGGSKELSVGRPGHGVDRKGAMTSMGENALAADGVPHLHRAVCAGRGETFSIRGPGHAKHSVAMTPAGEQVLPGGGIPHLHRLIITRRGDTSAIGRPGDGSHTGGMTTTDAQGGSQGLSGSWASNDCRSDLQGIRVKTSSRTSG